MNRQMRRRAYRKLNLNDQDIENLADHFKRENESREQALVYQFLTVAVEALRMEFGFGQKRIDRFTIKVNEILEDMELGYLNFEDLIKEVYIEPAKIFRLDEAAKKKINKKLNKGDKNEN